MWTNKWRCCGYDDVTTRKHFPHYWSFVQGINRCCIPPTNQYEGPVTRSFDVFLLACISFGTNVRVAEKWYILPREWCNLYLYNGRFYCGRHFERNIYDLFWFKFHYSMFLMTTVQHWFGGWHHSLTDAYMHHWAHRGGTFDSYLVIAMEICIQ